MYEGSHSRFEPHDALALRIERLYLRLLRLASAPALDPALTEILRLLADVTRCELVYVEIAGSENTPLYWLGHATYALPPGELRSRVSRDILERAITERTTIEATVPGAERSWRGPSMALSTPIGTALPSGVLYVERAAPFAMIERERLESVARHLSSLSPVMRGAHQTLGDELRALKERRIRESMERHRGNIAEAARALGVSRTLIYRVLEPVVAGRDTDTERSHSIDTTTSDMERNETQIVSNRQLEHQNVIANRERS
jgi:hypothetical protein